MNRSACRFEPLLLPPLLLLILSVPLLTGCDAAGESGAAVQRTDSAGIEIVFHSTDFLHVPAITLGDTPDWSLGVVSGNAPQEFFFVMDALRLPGDRVAVLDAGAHEVRVFGLAGTLEHAFGREGAGPGEFGRAMNLWHTAGDTLVVWDGGQSRISSFRASDGVFLASNRVRPPFLNTFRAAGRLDGGLVVLNRHFNFPASGFEESYGWAVLFDAEGEAIDSIGPLAMGRMGQLGSEGLVGGVVFDAQASVGAGGGLMAIAAGSEAGFRIYHAGDLQPRRIVRWDQRATPVGREIVSRYETHQVERATSDESRARARRILEVQPMADQLPFIAEVLVDDAGRVWLKRYQPMPAPDSGEWMIFTADGAFVANVSIPNRYRITRISEDEVIAVVPDEMDVQRVQGFAFRLDG